MAYEMKVGKGSAFPVQEDDERLGVPILSGTINIEDWVKKIDDPHNPRVVLFKKEINGKRTLGVYVELGLLWDNGDQVPEGKPNYSGSFGNMKISAYKNKSQAGNDYLGLSVYAPSGEPQGPSEFPMSPAVPLGTGVDDDIPF